MGFISSPRLALFFIERYKSVWDNGQPGISAAVGTEAYEIEYAMMQIKGKTVNGIGFDTLGKKVLEIGCGHGGICMYLAMNGADEVVGIDLSNEALDMANKIKAKFESDKLIRENVVRFEFSGAEQMEYQDEHFDVVVADNVLEHVNDIAGVLAECKRVLKPNGKIVIPNFPSIYSKFGPHLKYGSKIPWLHVFFTEQAICEAVYDRAQKHPELKLFDFYGGLKHKPKKFKDVRTYKDLSYITNAKFKEAVQKVGLTLEEFYVSRPLPAKILIKALPFLQRTTLDDVLSYGTSATLRKK